MAGTLSLAIFWSGAAVAEPAPAGGATEVYVSSFDTLTDLGFTVTPLGPTDVFQAASLPNPSLFFPITEYDPVESQIFHEGIGLSLTESAGSLELTNFIVDGDDGVVLADVMSSSVTAEDAEVFDLTDCAAVGGCTGLDGTVALDGLELSLTELAATVLYDEFMDLFDGAGLDFAALAGLPIGVANVFLIPEVVPEPTVVTLLGAASAGLAWRVRSRRRA
jgi:hypothetical protein